MPFDFLRRNTQESRFSTQRTVQVADAEPVPSLIDMEFMQQRGDGLISQVNALAPVQQHHQFPLSPTNALTIHSQEKMVPSVPAVHQLHPIAGDEPMQVTFTDPTDSGCAVCQVASTKTAAECIQALKSQGFLGPGSYHLVVNGQTMMPNQTLADARVADQATVVVYKMEQGATSRSYRTFSSLK